MAYAPQSTGNYVKSLRQSTVSLNYNNYLWLGDGIVDWFLTRGLRWHGRLLRSIEHSFLSAGKTMVMKYVTSYVINCANEIMIPAYIPAHRQWYTGSGSVTCGPSSIHWQW